MGSPSSASFLREAPAHVDASHYLGDPDDPEASAMAPALPPPLQAGSALAHAKGEALETHRYSKLKPEQTPRWREIFKQYDRDGGGDVDLRELGLMFRQVGQAPNEEQMKLFIEEVDIDRSGTIDFEEFCLLMMRQQRLTECPDWLYTMLHPPFLGDDGVAEAAVASLPQVATLHDGKYEASQRIKRHMRLGKTGADADALASEADLVGSTTRYVEPKPGSASHRPPECADLSRDLLLTVCDLLPSTEHIKVAQLSGHHATFGPFVCQELLWRLCTSTRTTVEHLELAYDDLGDEGAIAVAAAIHELTCLVSIDISGNEIGQRGATALYEALCQLPKGSRLQSVKLEDNPRISPGLQWSIQTQVLVNNLGLIVTKSRERPLAAGTGLPEGAGGGDAASDEARWAPGSFPLEQDAGGMQAGAAPLVALREASLSVMHMPALRTHLTRTSSKHPPVQSLKLHDCPRLQDGALAQLFAVPAVGAADAAPRLQVGGGVAPPPHAFLHHVRWLRLSRCDAGDLTCQAICEAVEGGHLRALVGLALDRNKELTLSLGGNDAPSRALASTNGTSLGGFSTRGDGGKAGGGTSLVGNRPGLFGGFRDSPAAQKANAAAAEKAAAAAAKAADGSSSGASVQTHFPLATRLGAALRSVKSFRQLDLCNNPNLEDFACAALVDTLLAPAAPSAGGEQSPSGLHNGRRRRSISKDSVGGGGMSEPPSLRVLHLGATGSGNSTAAAVASKLNGSQLECLCLGSEVGDSGANALAPALTHAAGCTTLRELWLGNKIGDMGLAALASALSSPHPLKLLGLGGKVRGKVSVCNRLDERSPMLLSAMLRQQPSVHEGLCALRLSGNAKMGGAGITTLLRGLSSCQSLREIHVDGCGLEPGLLQASAIMDAMNEVWCLHKLVLDTVKGAATSTHGLGGAGGGGLQKSGGWGLKKDGGKGEGGGGRKPLLSMQQRLGLAKLLEDNRRMGRQRVESWRLSRSLEEVAWVFNELCNGLLPDMVDGGLSRWDGEACGTFVSNVGLPQYSASFAFNLKGSSLPSLQSSQLSQLGVTSHEDQKTILQAVRHLVFAYERRDAVRKAQSNWSALLATLKPGQQIDAADAEDDDGSGRPRRHQQRTARDGRSRQRFKQQQERGGGGGGRGGHRSPKRGGGHGGALTARATLQQHEHTQSSSSLLQRSIDAAAPAAGAPLAASAASAPVAATPQQRPDPIRALQLAEATMGTDIGSTQGGGAAVAGGSGGAGGGGLRLPAVNGATPRGASQSNARVSFNGAVRGDGAGLLAVSGTPRGSRGGTGARKGGAAADYIGQPTTDREGAGALPINPWLAPRLPPARTPAAYVVRSPRTARDRASASQVDDAALSFEYGYAYPPPAPPPAGVRKPMRRDEEMSRRILASLAHGGKLQDDAAPLHELGRFIVPAKNVYHTSQREAEHVDGHLEGGAISAETQRIIRRRLGLG